MIEILVHLRKVKTKTPTCSLCVHTECGHWPRLDYPLIYMAQNNLNQQILVIIGSGNGLSVRCLAIAWTNDGIARRGKLMWNLNQFLHSMCSYINNIDDLSSRFQTFEIFLPVSSNSGGRNLFFPWSHCEFVILNLYTKIQLKRICILPIFMVVLPFHPFSIFFIFFLVSSASGGRNLFLPGSHHSFPAAIQL